LPKRGGIDVVARQGYLGQIGPAAGEIVVVRQDAGGKQLTPFKWLEQRPEVAPQQPATDPYGRSAKFVQVLFHAYSLLNVSYAHGSELSKTLRKACQAARRPPRVAQAGQKRHHSRISLRRLNPR